MSTSMIATLKPSRRSATIYADMEAQHATVRALCDLAASFYAHAIPTLIALDGGVRRIGPDPVPPLLRAMLRDETQQLERLASELQDAREREWADSQSGLMR